MKKLVVGLTALSVFLFAGCFNPVFENIEKEVPLAKGKIAGTVNSIVRFDDAAGAHLVCSNGETVFYKNCGNTRSLNGDSVWISAKNNSFTGVAYSYEQGEYLGQYILKTAADDKYVYVLTVEICDNGDGETSPSYYHLYYADVCPAENGEWVWTPVEGAQAILNEGGTSVTVFSTNDVEVSNRKAFLRGSKNTIYKLDSKVEDAIDASDITMGDGSSYSEDKTIKSALSLSDSEVVFFTTLASVKGADCYYYAVDDTSSKAGTTYNNTDIFMKKNGEAAVQIYKPRSSSGKNDGKPVMSLAVTGDYLLFGCGEPTSSVTGDGGIYHLSLGKINSESSQAPLSDPDAFVTNADATLTQYYEIRSLLVEDPEQLELDASIYASITFKTAGNSISVSYENKGLWAYYPERGNWNRE
ncbi:MAG: hypothetical protein MJ185_11690 [Treponema sp.]|nr:hypothetical protein [Treponema sp.]